jgi:hypothetical protein
LEDKGYSQVQKSTEAASAFQPTISFGKRPGEISFPERKHFREKTKEPAVLSQSPAFYLSIH